MQGNNLVIRLVFWRWLKNGLLRGRVHKRVRIWPFFSWQILFGLFNIKNPPSSWLKILQADLRNAGCSLFVLKSTEYQRKLGSVSVTCGKLVLSGTELARGKELKYFRNILDETHFTSVYLLFLTVLLLQVLIWALGLCVWWGEEQGEELCSSIAAPVPLPCCPPSPPHRIQMFWSSCNFFSTWQSRVSWERERLW